MSTTKSDQVRGRGDARLFGGFVLLLSALLLVAGFAATSLAQAGKPRFELAFTTDNRETREEKNDFRPDTAKIYVIYMAADIPTGGRLKAVWILEKAAGYQENAKIDESSTSPGAGSFMGAFSYSKPPKGWPVGAYKIELYVGDRLDKTVRFNVK